VSESKSIIDLCRSLPNSEPELRARALDFTRVVCVQVMGWQEVADVSEIPTERMGDTVYFEPFAGVVGDVSGNDAGSVLVYAGGDVYKFNPMVYIADAGAATDAILSKKESRMLIGYDGQHWRVQMRGVIDEWQVYARATAEELTRSAACVLAAQMSLDSENQIQ